MRSHNSKMIMGAYWKKYLEFKGNFGMIFHFFRLPLYCNLKLALIFGYLAIWLFSEQLEVNRKLEKDLKAVEAVEEKAAEEAKKAEEEAAEEAKKAEEAAEEAAQEEEAEVEEAKRAAAKMKNAQKKSNTQNISNSNKHRPLKRQSSELSIPSQRVRKPRIQPPSTSHESDIEKERIKADLRKTELKADIIRACIEKNKIDDIPKMLAFLD
ncbi:hypothetical protein BCR41DRAFT_147543 [Lobosporangium transversale]|uniref:Uncharacterized protein n=1 Tax=Lobosporangium transversale TaxID=64571 RepID=A0A1Y2GE38_9FUNG|nr:hypothetical protein BCR41DRAFT_147543 [Lobosporangium transversale]ORZ08260.1 hypothetical protein BCR41DRAFT_147543 [Lobosporangium transversale]|eukprot:XP_021878343.1 hypothetical protein BCR41DRAFT_147543 [Lobosporangium transversale]